MFSRPFWRGAIERALKTAAQSAAALFAVDGLNLLSLDWPALGAAVGLATVLSLLSSIVSSPLGPEQTHGSASLVDDVSDLPRS